MTHKNKLFIFFKITIIYLIVINGCIQTPVTTVIPIQTNILPETSTLDITATYTLQPKIAHEDTGYEGYYIGIVVITEYYTLLSNKLMEEAYNRLSLSEKNKISYSEFTQQNEKSVNKIVTIKPFIVWQIEQGISPLVADKEDQISFFVEIREGNTEANKKLQTLFLTLIKEDENWKINTFSENLATFVLETTTSPILDIGSVPDQSYYDSIVTIAQFHTLFNNKLYESSYQLLSPFRRNFQSLGEFISDIETFGIIERKIISINPFYEGTMQIQSFTTPDPVLRRMFYTEIYAQGKGGWAGSVPNGIYGYYITTVLENEEWKIYSVNTVGIP